MPRSQSIAVRGILGATTVEKDSPVEILEATRHLLAVIVRQNNVNAKDVSTAIFTMTADLTSASPEEAALQLGWIDIPLSCLPAINAPSSLQKCIQVLIHWSTNKPSNEVKHVYLNRAKILPSLLSQVSELSEAEQNELETWVEQHLREPTNSDNL